ncbi:hypothetical protein V1264_002587 [Littorina saxatilis]|uniref:Immunoglobulin V-set domain-containing protein n=1 Tax=Littorina saxatilis TaxID=31220 RepID=A0AAN9B3N1_9CAEN
MILLTLVTLTTVVCCLSACKLTGDVNATSHKLHLTCECNKTDDVKAFPIRRLQGLKINKEGDRLAWLNMDRNETERYAQNFTVLRSEFSPTQDHVLFTLLLDVEGEQSAMTFQCVAMGFGYNDFPMDYTVNRTIELSGYDVKIETSPAIYTSLSTSLTTIPTSGKSLSTGIYRYLQVSTGIMSSSFPDVN